MMQSVIRRVATQVGAETLIAVWGEHPLRCGNFFTLKMFDGKWAWVQNISVEDFKEICKRNKLYSVYVLYLPESEKCFVIDDRIPWDWFREYTPRKIDDDIENVPTFNTSTNYDAGYYFCPYFCQYDFSSMFLDEENSSVQQLEINCEDKGDN